MAARTSGAGHSENLLSALEHKNWNRFASFLADDYHDKWGNDRSLLLERSKQAFGYLRDVRIAAVAPNTGLDGDTGYWQARIKIDGSENELMSLIKDRVNVIAVPFQLQWRRHSAKPWDWKLVSVANDELAIPELGP